MYKEALEEQRRGAESLLSHMSPEACVVVTTAVLPKTHDAQSQQAMLPTA